MNYEKQATNPGSSISNNIELETKWPKQNPILFTKKMSPFIYFIAGKSICPAVCLIPLLG